MRRPRASRVMLAWSSSGAKPRRLSLKPFCPASLPWQLPELHPSRVSTGSTSFTNDGADFSAFGTGSSAAVSDNATRANTPRERRADVMRPGPRRVDPGGVRGGPIAPGERDRDLLDY